MNEKIPYGRQSIGQDEHDIVQQVLDSNWLTQGPLLAQFEEALAELCGARYAVAVANGTMALYLACRAANLGPGDKFLTTPMTFAATANTGLMCGAEPVFADIDPLTVNIDPDQVAAALARHPDIKVMLPVHFAGLMCELEPLIDLADRHGVAIIEDAAHAIGGHWQDAGGDWHGAGSCHRTAMGIFSFHPVKSMTTGEGGAITTNDDALAERLRLLRSHGITRDPARLEKNDGGWYYEMQELGINARLTDLQAALGMHQLKQLPAWKTRRLELVQRYGELLADIPGLQVVTRTWPGDRNCYHLMLIRSDRRRALYDHLHSQDILVQVHYIPVHLQPYYRRTFGFKPGDFPHTEKYYQETLSLPLFPALTDEDQDRVVAAIKQVHQA
nr:UDP-4-amino-4,6-dideoxy-N-acetyl-beta-L-altrosamine transaminase [Candidatus Krumholzibacteria bacterium]